MTIISAFHVRTGSGKYRWDMIVWEQIMFPTGLRRYYGKVLGIEDKPFDFMLRYAYDLFRINTIWKVGRLPRPRIDKIFVIDTKGVFVTTTTPADLQPNY